MRFILENKCSFAGERNVHVFQDNEFFFKSQNKTLVNKLQHVVFQLNFKKMKNNERQFSIFVTVLNLAFAIDCYC